MHFCESYEKNGVVPPSGIVLLSQKQIPVCETNPDDPISPINSQYHAFTRAEIDILPFKNKLLSLSPTMWDDENQEGNVKLHRPAHDAWGIKKIVFTFCDDYLMKVLDLPWSQTQEWKELLQPIYDAIGVSEDRIVRCLLASMPPGVSIPVHHDTGYWVKHTHRCHMAVITNKDVDFFIGPTTEQMQKYLFEEGKIVELNNRAKHAVNNRSDCHRVHLIFDYVDEHRIHNRYKLSPGEVVSQTRRTIDLSHEIGQRRSPTFLIIGAQKCGTTSMFELICQHPLVVRGVRRETHYFDWRYNKNIDENDAKGHYSTYLNCFPNDILFNHPSLVTGESTPSYLLHSDIVIPRIKLICPWIKLIIMLRNPVDRAFSQYQMCIDKNGTPEQLKIRGQSSYFLSTSFEEVIKSEINYLNKCGITPESSYSDFQQHVLSKCPMGHGGHSIIA
eukprot:gene13627-18286_t